MAESLAVAAPVSMPVRKPSQNYLYQENEIVPDWLKVLKWCFIPILICVVFWAIETYILKLSPRMVYNPAEFPCRVFGYSHYFVGLLFMLSSRKMQRVDSWLWLLGLLAVSLGICAFFYQFGGEKNPVIVIAYFLFFMVHGFRDMVFFYHRPDDLPLQENLRAWILVLFQACLLLFLFYVLAPAYLLYLTIKPKTYTPELQAQINALMPYLYFALQWAWILLLAAVICMWQIVRKMPEGWRSVWAMDKAILLVLIYTSLIILASPVVGPWTYNLLILSHFVGWYFYASRRLETLPKQAALEDGLWKWFRGSVKGFQWLHLGAAAVFLILILINHFVLAKTGVLETLFNSTAFYYWTVIHVTISLAPRN